MIDIKDKTPGDDILAADFNAVLAELRRLAKWRAAAPLELKDTDAGFIIADNGAGGDGAVRPCTLVSDGGSAGDNVTACSLTYTVTDALTLVQKGTHIAMWGYGKRLSAVGGTYTAGTKGLYFMDGDTVRLIWADEILNGTICSG